MIPYTRLSLVQWAAFLFIAAAAAQTCYYPSGLPSTDVPCSSNPGPSPCCPADSFCLANGLCFGEGIVSRSSCSDQSWTDEACPSYCSQGVCSNKNDVYRKMCDPELLTTSPDTPDSSVPLTPCSSNSTTNTFVCGLNVTDCSNAFAMSGGSSLVLRPAQVAALIQPELAAAQSNTTASSSGATIFTLTQVLAVACGTGIPLIAALLITAYFLWRERKQAPQLMYDLPDECKEGFVPEAPQRLTETHLASVSPRGNLNPFSDGDTLAMPAKGFYSPKGVRRSYMERFPSYKSERAVHHTTIIELDSTVVQTIPRYELADHSRPAKPPKSHRSQKSNKSNVSRYELGPYR